MPILPTPVTPPSATQEAAELLRRSNSDALNGAQESFRRAFKRLWLNPDATPQAIFNEFGTSAGKLLDALSARLDFVAALAIANGQVLNDYIAAADRTAPVAYTVSGNGTVTVTT